MTLLADGTADEARARRDWEGDADDDDCRRRREQYYADRFLEQCPIVGPMRRDEVLSHEHDNREDEDR